jgi:hypothetical protein
VSFSAFDKPKGAQFTFAARDIAPVANSEVLQILVRDRQPAVVFAAVVRQLYLDAIKNAPRG